VEGGKVGGSSVQAENISPLKAKNQRSLFMLIVFLLYLQDEAEQLFPLPL